MGGVSGNKWATLPRASMEPGIKAGNGRSPQEWLPIVISGVDRERGWKWRRWGPPREGPRGWRTTDEAHPTIIASGAGGSCTTSPLARDVKDLLT